MDGCAARVVIWTCVTDIPGVPQGRHHALAQAFCAKHLQRDFNWKLQASGYDHVHIPGDFDSDQPLKRWFILDLNVTGELGKEDVLRIPHQVFLASYQTKEL
jgi:methylsterol monooxygenase